MYQVISGHFLSLIQPSASSWSSVKLLIRYTVSVVFLPLRRTRRRNRAINRAPGKPTCSGVTSRHSKARISRRLRLRSRVSARVCVVGGGGKIALGQERCQGLNQLFLVFFDRQGVIAPALKED